MKVVIWILTFFIGTVLNTIIGDAIGIKAGAVLLYIVEYYIAKALCEKWDEHHPKKQPASEQKTQTASQPESMKEASPVEEKKAANFCKYCGEPLLPDSLFCGNCGEKVE